MPFLGLSGFKGAALRHGREKDVKLYYELRNYATMTYQDGTVHP